MSRIDQLRELLTGAGAGRESDTVRDGFLSYAAEAHALGAGAGLLFLIVAAGDVQYLGALIPLVLYGNRGDDILSPELIRDIEAELHYFLGGCVVGGALGMLARLAMGLDPVGFSIGIDELVDVLGVLALGLGVGW